MLNALVFTECFSTRALEALYTSRLIHTFTPIHTGTFSSIQSHYDECIREQIGVQYVTQRYSGIQTGAYRDQTINHPISR